MYLNKKYKRSGALFQGKFKSEHASNDQYLKYLFSYIHLNPVKLVPGESQWKESGIKNIEETKKFLKTYEYSGFRDYLETTPYERILTKNEFPEYFPTVSDMLREIHDWLSLAKVGPSQERKSTIVV